MANKLRQPYFTAELNSANCQYEIRINDIVLDSGGGAVVCELPLNHWVGTGENLLEMTIRPETAEAMGFTQPPARCKVTIYQREVSASFESREMLTALVFQPGSGVTGLEESPEFSGANPPKAVLREPRLIRAQRVVPLQTSFPAWTWVSALEIANNDATKSALADEYRRFWLLMNQRNLGAVDAAMQVNGQEIQAAYYKPSLSAALDDLDIRSFLADPAMRLNPFDGSNTTLRIFGRGRLAQLVGPNGKSPISFTSGRLPMYINLIYCRTSKGWIQIR